MWSVWARFASFIHLPLKKKSRKSVAFSMSTRQDDSLGADDIVKGFDDFQDIDANFFDSPFSENDIDKEEEKEKKEDADFVYEHDSQALLSSLASLSSVPSSQLSTSDNDSLGPGTLELPSDSDSGSNRHKNVDPVGRSTGSGRDSLVASPSGSDDGAGARPTGLSESCRRNKKRGSARATTTGGTPARSERCIAAQRRKRRSKTDARKKMTLAEEDQEQKVESEKPKPPKNDCENDDDGEDDDYVDNYNGEADIETEQYCGSLLKKLVSHKDVVTETFLKEVIDSLPQRDDLSSTELSRLWKDEARKRITNFSVTLSHKLSPLVQIMLDQKMSANLDSTFVEVATTRTSTYDMASRYQRCFNTWIDDAQCISFKATNTRLLGQVDIKDMFVLIFFTFLTCRRSRNDNVLQLGVVGTTTSGKTTLFESCLHESSHVTTNEEGVGRFQVGSKTVLLFHDIHIRTLVLSKDTEKIKTIARTEPTVTKVHSTTLTLPPLFLFYSSNERLMTHRFRDSLRQQPFQWRMYHGQVNETGGSFTGGSGNRKKATEENLAAVQNRFIEAFVRKPPKLDSKDLPESGAFQRIHGILGMYMRIVTTMERYSPEDFYSPVLRQYILHGLCSKFQACVQVMLLGGELNTANVSAAASRTVKKEPTPQKEVDLRVRLRALVDKHIDPSLQHSLLQFLKT